MTTPAAAGAIRCSTSWRTNGSRSSARGATALQAIPYLGRHARQVYVLQRTPSTVDQRYNLPTDPEWVRSLEPGWQKARMTNFHHGAIEGFRPGEADLVCDFWTEISRNLAAELEAEGWPELTPAEHMARREVMDFRVMERMRQRVHSLVKDKETAEALKPWYRFVCKRPLSNDALLRHVQSSQRAVDRRLRDPGCRAHDRKGFVADGVEYEVDCMIFASGFEVTSDLDRRWGIDVLEGRNGQSLYTHWANGYKTLHGVMTEGLPNQFFIGYYQGGLNATTTDQYNLPGLSLRVYRQGGPFPAIAAVEPGREAQDAYVRHLRETAFDMSDVQARMYARLLQQRGREGRGRDRRAEVAISSAKPIAIRN